MTRFEELLLKHLLPPILTDGSMVLTEHGIASVDPTDFRAFIRVLTSEPLLNTVQSPPLDDSDYVTGMGGELPTGTYDYRFTFLTEVCPKIELDASRVKWMRQGGLIPAGVYEYVMVGYNSHGDAMPSDIVTVNVDAISVFKSDIDGSTSLVFPDRFNSAGVVFTVSDIGKELYRTDTEERFLIASLHGDHQVRLTNLDGSAAIFGTETGISFQVRVIRDDNMVHFDLSDLLTEKHEGFKVYRRRPGYLWYLVATVSTGRLTWADRVAESEAVAQNPPEYFSGETDQPTSIRVEFPLTFSGIDPVLGENEVTFNLETKWLYGAKGLRVYRSGVVGWVPVRLQTGVLTYTGSISTNGSHMPVVPGRFFMFSYLTLAHDDGNGNIVGTNIASGWVNYVTGTWSVTLVADPGWPGFPIIVYADLREHCLAAFNYQVEEFHDDGTLNYVAVKSPPDTNSAVFEDMTIMPTSLDDFYAKITSLWKTISIDDCPDVWLPYLGVIIGYDYRNDWSVAHNRRIMKDWISFLRMRGSIPSFEWLMRQEGGRVSIYEPGIDVARCDVSPLDGERNDRPYTVKRQGIHGTTSVAHPTYFRDESTINIQSLSGFVLPMFPDRFFDTASAPFDSGDLHRYVIFDDSGGTRRFYRIEEVISAVHVRLDGNPPQDSGVMPTEYSYVVAAKIWEEEECLGRYLNIPDGVCTGQFKIAEAVDPITLNIPTANFPDASGIDFRVWGREPRSHKLGNWLYYHHGVYDVITNVDPEVWEVPLDDLLHPLGTRRWTTYSPDSPMIEMDWFENVLEDVLIIMTPRVFSFRAGAILDEYIQESPWMADGARVLWSEHPLLVEDNTSAVFFRWLWFSPAYSFFELKQAEYDEVNDFWEFVDVLTWGDRVEFQPNQADVFTILEVTKSWGGSSDDLPLDPYQRVLSFVALNQGGVWDNGVPGSFVGGTDYVDGVDFYIESIWAGLLSANSSLQYDTRVSSGANRLGFRVDDQWDVWVTFSDIPNNPAPNVVAEINAAAAAVHPSLGDIASAPGGMTIVLVSLLVGKDGHLQILSGGGNPKLGYTDYQQAYGVSRVLWIGSEPLPGTAYKTALWYRHRSF